MKINYEYRKATLDDLERRWTKNTNENLGDDRWSIWKQETIENNIQGKSITFVVLCNGDPIGEGTLLLSPECNEIDGRTELADNRSTANINGLRIQKEYEGKGHISKLVNEMEQYAFSHGYTNLTIGVEARETRNIAIYLHWGYDRFVLSGFHEQILELYYAKEMKMPCIIG